MLPFTVKISKKFNMLTEGTVICMLAFGVLYYLKMRLSGFNLTFYGTDWAEGFSLAFCFYTGSLLSLKETEKLLNLQLSLILLVIFGCIPHKGAIGELIIIFVISYFTISFAKAKNPVFSNWFTKCDFTYGIYLYAFPVQQGYSIT